MTQDEFNTLFENALSHDGVTRRLLGLLERDTLRNALLDVQNPDLRNAFKAMIGEGVRDAGVLTEATVHESGGLFRRVEESVSEVLDKHGVPEVPPKGSTP